MRIEEPHIDDEDNSKRAAGLDFQQSSSAENKPEKTNPKKTPFEDTDIKPTKPAKSLGVYLRHPFRTLGESFENLSREKKQNVMYIVQCTAAACLLAGGVAGLALGGAPIISAGMAATGALNGIRSAAQYVARRHFATSPEKSSRTEMANSFLSGATNAPQALSGSFAGVAAVLSYALRTMKYALENEQNKDIEVKKEDIKKDTEFHKENVSNTKSIALGPVKKGAGMLMKAFNKVAAGTGRLVQKLPAGQRMLDNGPGGIMIGRGGLQVAEGAFLIGAVGLGGGIPAIIAGVLYMGAATVMRSSDAQKRSPAIEMEAKEELIADAHMIDAVDEMSGETSGSGEGKADEGTSDDSGEKQESDVPVLPGTTLALT